MSLKNHLKQKSNDGEWGLDELVNTADKLEDILQNNLNNYLSYSPPTDGINKIIKAEKKDGRCGIWIGLTEDDLYNEFNQSELVDDFNRKRLFSVAGAHFNWFHSTGYTVGIPKEVDEKVKNPFHYPIWIPIPGGNDTPEEYIINNFRVFLTQYDLTPAELLDYWVTEISDYNLSQWSTERDVGEEAVRKNVRQAKKRIESDDDNNIQAVNMSDLSDGKIDEETEDMVILMTSS